MDMGRLTRFMMDPTCTPCSLSRYVPCSMEQAISSPVSGESSSKHSICDKEGGFTVLDVFVTMLREQFDVVGGMLLDLGLVLVGVPVRCTLVETHK